MSTSIGTVRRLRSGRPLLAITLALMLVASACTSTDQAETTTTQAAAASTAAPATTAAPGTTEPVVEGTPYKIGFVAAATGGGSSLGGPETNTARMLAEQWADGIVGPDGVHHSLEVVILDSESDPDVGASAVSRLITEDEVDVLVAGTLSGNSLAMAPLAEEAEIAMISMASSRGIIQDDTGAARPWIFKTPQENGHNAAVQTEYLTALGITTVCYLYENSGFGEDTLANGQTHFGDAGIEIVFSDSFERGDTEFPQTASVQSSGCEAVVVGAIPPVSALVTAALKDFVPDVPIVQGHGNCAFAFIDLAPDAVEGVPLPCGRMMVADGLPADDPQKDLLVKYVADYSAFTGGEPVSTFGGHAWDALQWAYEGLASLDDGADLASRRASVRDYIENNIQNWPGTGGVFNITADDHLGLGFDALTFVVVRDGVFAYFPPEDW